MLDWTVPICWGVPKYGDAFQNLGTSALSCSKSLCLFSLFCQPFLKPIKRDKCMWMLSSLKFRPFYITLHFDILYVNNPNYGNPEGSNQFRSTHTLIFLQTNRNSCAKRVNKCLPLYRYLYTLLWRECLCNKEKYIFAFDLWLCFPCITVEIVRGQEAFEEHVSTSNFFSIVFEFFNCFSEIFQNSFNVIIPTTISYYQ